MRRKMRPKTTLFRQIRPESATSRRRPITVHAWLVRYRRGSFRKLLLVPWTAFGMGNAFGIPQLRVSLLG